MTVSEMAAMGGNARRYKLTKKRRWDIAKLAANSRWSRNGNGAADPRKGRK